MKNPNLSQGDLLTDEVNVNLNVLRATMMNGVGCHVDSADIVAVDNRRRSNGNIMHDPHEPHLSMIKQILRYLKGTLSSGLHIGVGPVQSLVAYSDADWAGCPDSR